MDTLQEYKCPCCDGTISFDADSQKLKCPYCGTEFDIETIVSYDEELKEDSADNMTWKTKPETEWQEADADGFCTYVCNSCGGEIVGDENTASTNCPYCGSAVVVLGKVSGTVRPDFVIPFKIDKEKAVANLSEYYKGKKLLPKVFKDKNRIEEVKGLYVPVWLFDTEADAHMRYRATRHRFWSDSKYNYTETSYYSVTRAGSLSFENVPVDGSSKMDDELMESIEPFDFSEAVDFQTAYLAGYLTDKYDVDAEASINRANERIKKSTEEAFADMVHGYSSVIPVSNSVKFDNGSEKYALYLVWLLKTEWEGKKYFFAVNGQTGKVAGDLPMDKTAYLKWFWGLASGIGIGTYLILKLFETM